MQSAPPELYEWSTALIAQAHPFEAGRGLTRAEMEWLTLTHARLAQLPLGDAESRMDATKSLVAHVWKHRPRSCDGLPVQWIVTPIATLRTLASSISVDLTAPPASCFLVCGYLDPSELSIHGRLAIQDGTGCMPAEWCTPDVTLLHNVFLLESYSVVCPAAPSSSSQAISSGKRQRTVPRAENYLQVRKCCKLARPRLAVSLPPEPPLLRFWSEERPPPPPPPPPPAAAKQAPAVASGPRILTVSQLTLRPAQERSSLLHLCGTVTALSPLVEYSASQPPFFLVEVRDDEDFATHVLFSGETVAWHAFIKFGQPHLFTNLKPAVLFKNKPNELRMLTATAGGADPRHWTYPYQLDEAQARVLTRHALQTRTRPDAPLSRPSPSKRARGASQSQRTSRHKQRATERLHSWSDVVSYSGTITAVLAASAYILDDEIKLYLSHTNCRPSGRCMEVGALVTVRKAHPLFDANGKLCALGCCSYGHVEVQSFATDKSKPWQPIVLTSAWHEFASQVSLTSYHWLVETADVLALKFGDAGNFSDSDLEASRKRLIGALIDQLGLSAPKRNIYAEFTDHARSCLLWQPPYVPYEVLLLREVRGLAISAARPRVVAEEPPLPLVPLSQASLPFPPVPTAAPAATAVAMAAPQTRILSESSLPRGQLLIGVLSSSDAGELQLSDGSASIPIVFSSDMHLSPSDLGSTLIASRYTFYVQHRGAKKELFLTCTPSARLQDTGAVLIRPTQAARTATHAQSAYAHYVCPADKRQIRSGFLYVVHKQPTSSSIDVACYLLLPPSPPPPGSPASLPQAAYPYNEHGRTEPVSLRAVPSLAVLLHVGRCYWVSKLERDRDGHLLLAHASEVHEAMFIAAEDAGVTFPPASSTGCLELRTSLPSIQNYTRKAEERPQMQSYRATLSAFSHPNAASAVTAQVVSTEALTENVRRRYGLPNVRGLACYVRDPTGAEAYVLPVFFYEEHAGGDAAPLALIGQCGHLLLPGALLTFRLFELGQRGWPYLFSTSRSAVTVECLPTEMQPVDTLERFRMLRHTTYLAEINPLSMVRDTKVYRLRCRADLFKLQLSWRCSICGEARSPSPQQALPRIQPLAGKSPCTCVDSVAVFTMEATFNVSDGTGEANLEIVGENNLCKLFMIRPADAEEMAYLREQTAKYPQARLTITVLPREGIQISDSSRTLLELPRIRVLIQRFASTARPMIFYTIVKPPLAPPLVRERELKLKNVTVRTPALPRMYLELVNVQPPLLAFEEVVSRAEARDLLSIVKQDIATRSSNLLPSG